MTDIRGLHELLKQKFTSPFKSIIVNDKVVYFFNKGAIGSPIIIFSTNMVSAPKVFSPLDMKNPLLILCKYLDKEVRVAPIQLLIPFENFVKEENLIKFCDIFLELGGVADWKQVEGNIRKKLKEDGLL